MEVGKLVARKKAPRIPKGVEIEMWVGRVSLQNIDTGYRGPMLIVRTEYSVESKEKMGEADKAVDDFVLGYVNHCASDVVEGNILFDRATDMGEVEELQSGRVERDCGYFFADKALDFHEKAMIDAGRHFSNVTPFYAVDIKEAERYIRESYEDNSSGNLYVLRSISEVYGFPGKSGSRILEDKSKNKLVYETVACLDDFLDKYHGKAERLSVVLEDAGDLERN